MRQERPARAGLKARKKAEIDDEAGDHRQRQQYAQDPAHASQLDTPAGVLITFFNMMFNSYVCLLFRCVG